MIAAYRLLFKVKEDGRSYNFSYDEAFNRHLFLQPFVWKNSLYMVTDNFAIYRMVYKGKLVGKGV